MLTQKTTGHVRFSLRLKVRTFNLVDPRLKPTFALLTHTLSGSTEVGVMVPVNNEDQTAGHLIFLRQKQLFKFLPEPVEFHTFGSCSS